MTPINQDIATLQKEVKSLKNEKDIEINNLKEENGKLKMQLRRVEMFQRKNNIRFYNIAEERNENLEMKVIALCNKYLGMSDCLVSRSFERIHRMGQFAKGRTRVVIARLTHFKDKLNILKSRRQLKTVEGIGVSEDFSPEVELERKQLYPVMVAMKEKLQGADKETVYLKEDKLTVKGKGYNVRTLDSLPSDLSVHKLFTPSKDNITAFFTRNSVFSNHHPCSFVVDGVSYSSMEKFLFRAKA